MIGNLLRLLELTPTRDRKGFAIRFTDPIRRRVHEIAVAYDVATARKPLGGCPLRSEIFALCDVGSGHDPPINAKKNRGER